MWVCVLVLLVQSSFASESVYSMFQANAEHSGVTSAKLSSQPTKELWKIPYTMGSYGTGLTSVSNGSILVTSRNVLSKVDLDGTFSWNFTSSISDQLLSLNPLYSQGTIFFSGSTCVDGGTVGTSFYAIDEMSGNRLTSYEDPDISVCTSPTMVNDLVLFEGVSKDSSVVLLAFDSNMNLKWNYSHNITNWGGYDGVSASTDLSMIYLAAIDALIGLDISGKQVWNIALPNALVQAAPSVGYEESVLMFDTSSHLNCYDGKSGKLLWKKFIPDVAIYSISVMPAISQTNYDIYINYNGGIICLTYDGTIQWNRTLDGTLVPYSPMITGDGSLLVAGPGSNLVYSIDAQTGDILWQVDAVWPTLLHVTENSNLIYLSAYGVVHCLG